MKILFFAPHSAIWIHAFPEALVAEALQDSGHEVVYVTCGRQFRDGCIAMTAFGLGQKAPSGQREAICRRCESRKDLLRDAFSFAGFDIAETLTAADHSEIARLLETAKPDNILDLEACGIPVGRPALYEFLLEYKKSTIEFADEAEWARYRVMLANTLAAAFAARTFLERQRPDAVVVYNALYSVNRVVCLLAQKMGISTYFLHAGGNLAHRLQTLMLYKGDIFGLMGQAIAQWPSYRDLRIDADAARSATDHFLELLSGRSVFAYSSPQTGDRGLHERFGIAQQQKVICATLSSSDERFAAESISVRAPVAGLLYPTQAEWVHALIGYARARPELFLIIRVHPREFPNKREGVKAAHARQLEEVLQDLPSNVTVNWPDDDLSLYDLAEITDVFLNAWSSAGKEMGMLGIPVVFYSEQLPLYPVDPRYLGTDSASYFAAIERALDDGWRYENVAWVFRWCAIEYSRMLIDISDAFTVQESRSRHFVDRAVNKARRFFDPDFAEKGDCNWRPRPIAARAEIAALFETGAASPLDLHKPEESAAGAADDERRIIGTEIGRILHTMYPKRSDPPSRLATWLATLAGHAQLA